MMKTTKIKSNLFEINKLTSFDDEVLESWSERARIQLSYMNAIAAYLD